MGKKLRSDGTLSEEQVKARVQDERQILLDELNRQGTKSSKFDLRD